MEDSNKENIEFHSNSPIPRWTKIKTPSRIVSVQKVAQSRIQSNKKLPNITPRSLRRSRALLSRNLNPAPISSFSMEAKSLQELLQEHDIREIKVLAEEISFVGEARDEITKHHLKKVRPKQRIILSGYTKEYVSSETKRLANGYRELMSCSESFMNVLVGNEKKYHDLLSFLSDSLSNSETKRRILMETKVVVEEESKSLKSSNESLEIEVVNLKADIASEKERVEKFELREKEAILSCEKLQKELVLKESQFQSKLDVIKSEKDNLLRVKEDELSNEREIVSKAKEESQRKENEITKLKSELAQFKLELNSFATKIERIESEKKLLEKQNNSLEEKILSRDNHLAKTLETFQENQKFSQTRIDQVLQEKKETEESFNSLQNNFESLKHQSQRNEEEALKRFKEFERKCEQENSELLRVQEQLQEEKTKLEVLHKQVRGEYLSEKEKWAVAEKQLKSSLEAFTFENDSLKSSKSNLESELQAMKETYESEKRNSDLQKLYEVNKEKELLKKKVIDFEQLKEKLLELSDKVFKSEQQNRELRNEIHTLKGTVRVIARVKPSKKNIEEEELVADLEGLAEEDKLRMECEKIVSKLDRSITNLNDSVELGLDEKSIEIAIDQDTFSGKDVTKRHFFSFNHVFGPQSQQAEVFDEVSTFVQSALDGYNVCLFSYGQTGSGKTYTMTGDPFNSKHSGIIPRSTKRIIEYKRKLENLGWTFELEVMILEIYNETLVDLLVSRSPSKLEVRDCRCEIIVTNAKKIKVNSIDDIQHLLLKADKARKVSATEMNSQSSRSHTVFTMYISGKHERKRARLKGSLSLCDLAGSERLKRSNVEGHRLKETQSINKSLSALSDIFCAIKRKNKHIPYRNSLLTKLLKPCFDGQGKVLMIVNLSTEEEDLQETLCSLRFAEHVSRTKVGRARKNVDKL